MPPAYLIGGAIPFTETFWECQAGKCTCTCQFTEEASRCHRSGLASSTLLAASLHDVLIYSRYRMPQAIDEVHNKLQSHKDCEKNTQNACRTVKQTHPSLPLKALVRDRTPGCTDGDPCPCNSYEYLRTACCAKASTH